MFTFLFLANEWGAVVITYATSILADRRAACKIIEKLL